ncbi:hypothetical protein F0562_024131 [Nyssa sinensis]|uniref:OCEL domain-containing protein n=1 Tax=Nyssa sinensis TaxID=561372 RepID=A0A5J5BCT6_9ASTE|nr:hypothetical protein F0562_024131 [Nyssa sinensis]
MYGSSGKLGRGGGGRGGVAGKRNIHSTFRPPPLHRSYATPGDRLPIGGTAGPRNLNTTAGPTTSASCVADETFSLVTGNPLDFAMIIRLAPDLIEEIKRVEAQGGTARIKFDSNANNSSGNVIDVGGKDFRFTWSREMGDLCDIYEERQSGEDGDGLLIESGCAWRKLNVQRVLDESTKKHVKMRSQEAERKLKSRKAIVLDHGNSSMKSQIKALAAVEVNPWRTFKQKKEPEFKKRKLEPPPVAVGGPPKSVCKSGLTSTISTKGRHSVSSLSSPPGHSGALTSPFAVGNHTKGQMSVEDVAPVQATSKENFTSSENEMPGRAISGAVPEKPGLKRNSGAKSMDLRSMLISLLIENPKGMSLKALEKAIGDTIPNSVRNIGPIIKKIAIFQAPGRYFLKPGVELENFKKPSSESRSSPEDNHHQTPAPEDNRDQTPTHKLDLAEKMATEELEEQAQLKSMLGEESSSSERPDILHHSPDLCGDKKVSDYSEGPAGSSSESGSDSDSESDSSGSGSGGGSHGRSRSKSRSPVGSGSRSKEGSDEDVDIMASDDDKESKHQLQASELGLSTSTVPWTTPDSAHVQNGINEKQDRHGSNAVEIEKYLPYDDQETEVALVANSATNIGREKPVEEIKSSSPDRQEHQENQVYTGNLFMERENMAKDGFKHEQSDNFEGMSKRGSDTKHSGEKSYQTKRLKARSFTQSHIFRGEDSLFSESPHKPSPDRLIEDPCMGPSTQMENRAVRDGNPDSVLQKGHNQAIPGKSTLDSQQSGRRPVDFSTLVKAPKMAGRPAKYTDSLSRGDKYSEKSLDMHEGFHMQKEKVYTEAHDEDGYPNEKKLPRSSKDGGVGDKQSALFDSHYAKCCELVGKFEAGQVSNLLMGDNNRPILGSFPIINGRGSMLQREPSDLELGELCEPLPEETPGVDKQFERRSSFKHSEDKPNTSDYWNSDLGKGKPAGITNVDPGKLSPSHLKVGVSSNSEGSSKRRTPDHHTKDLIRPHHRVVQSQPQHLSRVDHAEVGPQFNKLTDASRKTRHTEAGASQGIGLEGNGDAHKKAPVSASQQHFIKETKMQKSNALADLSNSRKDNSLMESDDGGRKRSESSSDDNGISYSKYEKEEPVLKGPIKNFSQYKEYVREYGEKHDSYCSLNRSLETYRDEFQQLGRELESTKGRDMEKYYNILGQLKESYCQCGMRHKQLKKIFVVLHEELKVINPNQSILNFEFSSSNLTLIHLIICGNLL